MQGPGRPNDRRGRMGAHSGGTNMLTTAAIAAVGLAAVAVADHTRAQAEGRESAVQGVMRWFREDVLGVEGGGSASGPSRSRASGGLSRQEIEALPTRVYRQADVDRARGPVEARGADQGCAEQQVCAICQDVFVPEDVLLRLQCFHEFHQDCISSFLASGRQAPMCPCCRHPVVIE